MHFFLDPVFENEFFPFCFICRSPNRCAQNVHFCLFQCCVSSCCEMMSSNNFLLFQMYSSRAFFLHFASMSLLLAVGLLLLDRFALETMFFVVFLLGSSINASIVAFRPESTHILFSARILSTIICMLIVPMFFLVSMLKLTNQNEIISSNSSNPMLFGNSFENQSAQISFFLFDSPRLRPILQIIIDLIVFLVHFAFLTFHRATFLPNKLSQTMSIDSK